MEGLRLAWARVPAARPDRRTVAWALLRGLLADAGSPHAVLTNPCPRCGGPHGPVRVNDERWFAAVTYAGASAIVGIHPRAGAAGFALDAEPLHDSVREAAGGVAGGLRRWVRVEAALKATGLGLRVDPASVHVAARDDGTDWSAAVPDAARQSVVTARGQDLSCGPPGILLCAALVP